MRIEEARKMRKGAAVWWRSRRGEVAHGTFIEAFEAIMYDICGGSDLYTTWKCEIQYTGQDGTTKTIYKEPREVHKA